MTPPLMLFHTYFQGLIAVMSGGLVVLGLISFFNGRIRKNLESRLKRLLDQLNRRKLSSLQYLTAGIFLFLSFMKISAFLLFQTQHDFGWYINTIWNTLNGKWLYSSMGGGPFLATHFTPVVALFSPLFLLWKNPIIIMVAESAVLAASVPLCFSLARSLKYSTKVSFLWCLLLLFNPYFHHNTQEYFHPVSLGLPLLLWWLNAYVKNKPSQYWIPFFLLCLNEAIPLVLIGLGVFALLEKKKSIGSYMVGLGLVSFWLEIGVIIPMYREQMGGGAHLFLSSYDGFGKSYTEIFTSLILNPFLLFTTGILTPHKILHTILFLATTGALLFCFKYPRVLIPLIFTLGPYVLAKGAQVSFGELVSNFWDWHPYVWHHAAAPLAISLWGAMLGFKKGNSLAQKFKGIKIPLFLFLMSFGLIISPAHVVVSKTTKEKHEEARTALSLIPHNSPAWVSTRFTGHVPFREKLKSIPPNTTYPEFFTNDLFIPDYILSHHSGFIDQPYRDALVKVVTDNKYETIFRGPNLILLRRVTS